MPRVTVAIIPLVVLGFVAAPAAADPGINVSTTVTATCTTQIGAIPRDSFVADFPVSLSVSKIAHAGQSVTAHLSVGFAVSSTVTLGIAELSGGPAVVPPPPVLNGAGVIAADPGASTITGDLTFAVVGAIGDHIQWQLGTFGQVLFIGSTQASVACVPNSPAVLADTRVVGKGHTASG